MAFAWSCIEFVCNQFAVGLGDVLHGVSFFEVLSDQSVCVFVGAALPRVVGCGEVADHRVLGFDAGIVVELGSVIEGDGLESSGMLFEGF